MKRIVFTPMMVVLGMLLIGAVMIEPSQSRERQGQDLGSQEIGETKSRAQQAGTLPEPPPDPRCPIGSMQSGPISIRTYSKKCKVNGKDGSQMCISKMVHCVGGVGVPDTASTENCGPCVVLKKTPGSVEPLEGR